MLPVMYVSVGAHFANLDTGVSRDVSCISVTGQVYPGATTESGRLAAWGLGVGRVISQESQRKPAGVTGVLLLGCRLLTPFV